MASPSLKTAEEIGKGRMFAVSPRAEWDLLLAACSVGPAEKRVQRVRELVKRPFRADRLLQIAEQHGTLCLLHEAVAECSEDLVDQNFSSTVLPPDFALPDFSRLLRQKYESNLHKALLTARELLRVHDSLEKLDVEVLAYKGLALAENLYGDWAARQPGDIDLLIRPRDLGRVKNAVHELGYAPRENFSRKQEEAYLVSGYECAFDHPAGKNLLEVKWALQPRFYAVEFDVGEIFRRAVPATVAGRAVKTLSNEDLVLVLSVHAAKHAWNKLIWLCDFARLMGAAAIDWEWVADRARELGIVRILHISMILASLLLAAKTPKAFEIAVSADRAARSLAEEIERRIADGIEFDADSMDYFRFMTHLRERRMDRWKFLWRLSTTAGPGEWNAVQLPDPFDFFYRAVRLWRLARRMISVVYE